MRPGTIFLAAGGGVAVVVLATSLLGPAVEVGEEHPPQLQPVVQTTLVCPYVDGSADGLATRIGVLAIDGVSGDETDSDGEPAPITVTPMKVWDAGIDLDDLENDDQSTASPEPTETAEPTKEPEKEPEPLFSLPNRGDPAVKKVKASEPSSFAVEAQGKLAAGVAAEALTSARRDELHGYSTAACTAPQREHWFVGGSGGEGKRGTLVLSNPSNVGAVVDVDVWTENGPIDAAATQDISVPSTSQRILLLDALAPDSAQVAVHVSTERGKVAAAMQLRETSDGEARGLSYVPAAQAPAEELVVPGVTGAGKSSLQLFNPGEIDAIVELEYLGANGPFAPAGQNVVTVPGGGVLTVPLKQVNGPIAVAVSSDEPVTAAVRSKRNSEELPDVAFTAATAPLTGPAAALLGKANDDFTSSLLISSVAKTPSRADIQLLDNDGKVVDEQTVDVAPGATVATEIEKVDNASYTFAVIRPADPGALVAARQVYGSADDGAFIDVMPVTTLAVEVQVPEVVNELPEIPDPDEEIETP